MRLIYKYRWNTHTYKQTHTWTHSVLSLYIDQHHHHHGHHRSQDQDLHLPLNILQPQACLVSVRAGGRLHSELVFLFSSLIPGNLGVDVDIEWVMALR